MTKGNQSKPKETKARAPKKAEKEITAAVGPVAGELEGAPDAPTPAKPAGKPIRDEALANLLDAQFAVIEKTLTDSVHGKQPRQLRWALKSLDAAKDAALRHARHNG